jgi:hypothetical protein
MSIIAAGFVAAKRLIAERLASVEIPSFQTMEEILNDDSPG